MAGQKTVMPGRGNDMNEKIAQTYVWYNNEAFFVSTANRECSSPLSYGHIYAETMVWEWNPETRTRGKMIGCDECAEGSIFAHQRMVKRIFDTGLCEEEV